MGIRQSTSKNKKSNQPTDATPVEREDILRRAANVRYRFDSSRRGPGSGSDRAARAASPSQDGRSAPRAPGASPGK
jgi:hypothetical protein